MLLARSTLARRTSFTSEDVKNSVMMPLILMAALAVVNGGTGTIIELVVPCFQLDSCCCLVVRQNELAFTFAKTNLVYVQKGCINIVILYSNGSASAPRVPPRKHFAINHSRMSNCSLL